MPHIGIALGKTSSQVCILTEDGELSERRITTTRSSFTRLLGERQASCILLEASTESEWVAQYLEGFGHQVVVANPNFAPMYATRSKRVKTDKRDARALAEACRLGAYRQAHRSSPEQRQRRQMLCVREALVRTRARYISLIKTLVRQTGERLNSRDSRRMVEKVSAMPLPEHLHVAIAPLLAVMQEVTQQIMCLDAELKVLVKEDPLVKRLCSVPRDRGEVCAAAPAGCYERVVHPWGHVRAHAGTLRERDPAARGHREVRLEQGGAGRGEQKSGEVARGDFSGCT